MWSGTKGVGWSKPACELSSPMRASLSHQGREQAQRRRLKAMPIAVRLNKASPSSMNGMSLR